MRKYLPIRFSLTVILLPVVLSAFCGLSVAQAQRGSTDVLVTSTLRDSVSVTDPNTGTTVQIPMQIHGDGSAYNTIPTRRDYLVKSVIQSIGDWELYSNSPTRGMYLDLSQPIQGSGPNGGNPTRRLQEQRSYKFGSSASVTIMVSVRLLYPTVRAQFVRWHSASSIQLAAEITMRCT